MFSVALGLCAGSAWSQQEYPNRPIRFVTTGVGGGLDFLARLVAQGINGPLGQTVTVENRAGSGAISGEIVAKAPPDGYTFLLPGGSLWISSFFQKTPYDPVRDFTPITQIGRAPLVLVVHPSLPVKSVKELITLAKARNNELDYSSATTGSTSHLAAELFKSMTGTNIVRIPYSSVGTEITDLLSGRVQISFATAASIAPHVKSGKLRGLAVTSVQRSALAPDLPTVAASGVPGFEMITLYGLLAPARLPAPIVNRMNREVARFITLPEQKEKLLAQGVEAVVNAPEQFAEAINSQMTRLGKLIKDLGLKAD
jgi:tripartite-type tricarboxylate transporter receptor subunit TctC